MLLFCFEPSETAEVGRVLTNPDVRLSPSSGAIAEGPRGRLCDTSWHHDGKPSYARDAECYAFLLGSAEIAATAGVVEPRDEDPRLSRQRLPKTAPRRRVLGDVLARKTRATRASDTLCHFG